MPTHYVSFLQTLEAQYKANKVYLILVIRLWICNQYGTTPNRNRKDIDQQVHENLKAAMHKM